MSHNSDITEEMVMRSRKRTNQTESKRKGGGIKLRHILCLIAICMINQQVWAQQGKDVILTIQRTEDFDLDGEGSASQWSAAEWTDLRQLTNQSNSNDLSTRVKVLYSETGLYFLFECRDSILTATMEADFERLWQEDVVEVFLWPDESTPHYFEYELSPLNYELVLLIENEEGNMGSWQPFSYPERRQTRHETAVEGGERKSGASVTKWTAEMFIPYRLMGYLNKVPPEPGSRWRANMYRIDYDEGQTLIAWQPVDSSFHEYDKFGTIAFE